MISVGDRVTISMQGTRFCSIKNGYFSRTGNNPFGVEGVVEHIRKGDASLPYMVRWDNGHSNAYTKGDLSLINLVEENE